MRVIGAAVLAAATMVWLKAPGARAGPYGGAADAVAGTEAAIVSVSPPRGPSYDTSEITLAGMGFEMG
ncbi:MAG: hypothetical protein DMF51_11665, partial [Acidobacteria bacterium]